MPVSLGTEVLIKLVINFLIQEVHTAVTEQKLGTARMRGFEADVGIPRAGPVARVGC